jgi:hypothetical protein
MLLLSYVLLVTLKIDQGPFSAREMIGWVSSGMLLEETRVCGADAKLKVSCYVMFYISCYVVYVICYFV